MPVTLTLLGLTIVAALLFKRLTAAIRLPEPVIFIILGLLLHAITGRIHESEHIHELIHFLGQIGLVLLLFRVGLESNLKALLQKLKPASFIWFFNVVFSITAGYFTARYWLELTLIPSLFIATAFAATSVGIPLAIWQSHNRVNTRSGEMLLDVAELDDISSVFMMVILFSLAPVLNEGGSNMITVVAETSFTTIISFLLFALCCLLFALYIEKPLSSFLNKIERKPDPMVSITGLSLAIAGAAAMTGFSSAIGGFFAGLIFSRDTEAVRQETSIESLFSLFVPFFFISIGLKIELSALSQAFEYGLLLLPAAALSKWAGAYLPALPLMKQNEASILGLSMIPRAEISLIVLEKGLSLGKWAVPQPVFSGFIIITLVTCSVIPWLLNLLLPRYIAASHDSRS